jgi:hypothetical protein
MEQIQKKRAFIPIHGAATRQKYDGVEFFVNSHFCGWESIITRLQELMIDDLSDQESACEDIPENGDLFGSENTREVSSEKS